MAVDQLFTDAVRHVADVEHALLLFHLGMEHDLEQHIAQLQETLALLDYKCWYYETACRAGTEDAVRSLLCSQVPDRCRAAREKLDLHLK